MTPRARSPLLCWVLLSTSCVVAPGCAKIRERTHPTDAQLIAYFHEHRADLDRLREIDEARVRLGVDTFAVRGFQEWTRLIRRLRLPGGGAIESANRIFIPVNGRRLARDSVDVKGFAWIDSLGAIGARIDTLTDLDALGPRARGSGGRHVRHLERFWHVYRWIDVRMRE
jgi:hypothetical protein